MNDNATQTAAEAFVASLPAKGVAVCMGMGRLAPKGVLGLHDEATHTTNVDPEIRAQFESLPRAEVYVAVLATFNVKPVLNVDGDLGLATPLGESVDGETREAWLSNLADDFKAEVAAVAKQRGYRFVGG